jgi:hypothetical protein
VSLPVLPSVNDVTNFVLPSVNGHMKYLMLSSMMSFVSDHTKSFVLQSISANQHDNIAIVTLEESLFC